MNDITCPSCDKSFKLEEAGYAAIVKQVRDREFDTELLKREQLYEKEKSSAIEIAQLRVTMEKDEVITSLNNSLTAADHVKERALLDTQRAYEAQIRDRDEIILNRPGFTRHFLAYKFRPSRGCHEWEAIYRGISN